MLVYSLLSRLKNVNIFATPNTANNEYELKNEKISTVIFIFLLILSVVIIFIYAAQTNITHTINEKNPSYDKYKFLSSLYPETLRCSCDNVAIFHDSFILIEVEFHQICSSNFITKNWIDHIGSSADLHISEDFSYLSALIFLTLASFCHRANETILNAIQTYNSDKFITAKLLSESVFNKQIDGIIQIFQSSTELKYYQSFNLIQFSIQENQLLSGLLSNTVLQYDSIQKLLSPTPRLYADGRCSCDATYTCIAPLTLEDRRINSSLLFTIPGLYKGCYLVEAVRQSTLECLYKISCIEMIELYLQPSLLFNNSISPLNLSNENNFNVSSRIDQLISKIMVEKWNKNVSYEKYFIQCQVSSCTYSYNSKFNLIYIITTLISLVGGLTKVLYIIIPRLVKFLRHRFKPDPTRTNELNPTIHYSLLERLRAYNYFSKPYLTSTEIEVKQQIISTRLFIIILILSLIILISYYGTEKVVTLHKIESPTFDQFISLQSDPHINSTLSCPCSTLTVAYEKFIQLKYTFHPFCSSDFIQQEWLDSLILLKGYIFEDFRTFAAPFFNSLASYCKICANHITNSLISFNTSLFIINEALTPLTFVVETEAIITSFISSMTRTFARNLALSSNMTQSNGLMSSRMTNFVFVVDNANPPYFKGSFGTVYSYYFINNTYTLSYCYCLLAQKCYMPFRTYSYEQTLNSFLIHFTVPDLFLDCFFSDGIRYSTFICLFNQSCVDRMSYWLNMDSVNAMDINNLVHFKVKSSIDDILNEIFVDYWNYSISHRDFYKECRPDSCTYTLIETNSFWFIVTTIFGLIGGLIKILQFIIPYLIKGIYALYIRCRHENHQEISSTTNTFTFSIQFIINRFRQLNLFSSDNPNEINEYEIQNQIISTRIFLIFLILSVVVLTIYSSQVQLIKTVTIMNPSVEQYQLLYDSHSQTLKCPCKNIIFPQKTFLTIQPIFHQACESVFIDDKWIITFNNVSIDTTVSIADFRNVGGFIFRTIQSFCRLSFTIINDGLLEFGKTSFITIDIISQNELVQQGQSLIDLFISSNENTFITSLQTIRDTTQANVLLSGRETSITLEITAINGTNVQMLTRPRNYLLSGILCSCYDDPTCVQPAGLYNYPENILYYTIPGFYIGCYVVEATLKSNLAAFYNQSWLNDFLRKISFYNYTSIPMNITAMNSSVKSQYNITTPIDNIVKKLMIESWSTHINFSAYYEQCHPIECKYTYIVKYDLIYIITTIIGLIGGLVTVYQFIIPRLVKLIRRLIRLIQEYRSRVHRHTNIQVAPTVSVSDDI